jgi:transcriptional regulator with XRE-family HTH domain
MAEWFDSENMIPMPSFIRKLRLGLGMTMEQLAREIGVSLPTIQRWETGKAKAKGLSRKALLVWACKARKKLAL